MAMALAMALVAPTFQPLTKWDKTCCASFLVFLVKLFACLVVCLSPTCKANPFSRTRPFFFFLFFCFDHVANVTNNHIHARHNGQRTTTNKFKKTRLHDLRVSYLPQQKSNKASNDS
jgi:hypothetical protein